MKYESLLRATRNLPAIESSTLRVLGEERRALGVQLSRWAAAGKLVQLRRGIYLLPPELRAVEPPPFYLANLLVRPSYVSLESALAYHGLIPERVPLVQSITTARPGLIALPGGAQGYQYRHVKVAWFFGFKETPVAGGTALIAEPEKALLDLFYLSHGEFPIERIEELRLELLDQIDARKLLSMARVVSPRVRRAAANLLRWLGSADPGELR